jgi:hypothetical protein
MTLGNAAAARVRLNRLVRGCQHQVEPDAAEMAARYGAETPVLDWYKRLVCSQCGGREIDFVLTGRGGEGGRAASGTITTSPFGQVRSSAATLSRRRRRPPLGVRGSTLDLVDPAGVGGPGH